jgi:hypothetical protein
MLLYEGEELSHLRLQYKDYSEWQTGSKQEALLREQEAYWLKLFPGEIPVNYFPVKSPCFTCPLIIQGHWSRVLKVGPLDSH